jgi:hypothetical protein
MAQNVPTLKSSVKESKTKGVFEFSMPSSISKTDIEKSAKNYIKYFTTAVSNDKVVLKMVENTSNNRHIMKRFFVSLNQRTLNDGNKDLSIDTFFTKYVL